MLDTEPTDQTYKGRKLIDVYELTVRGLECQKLDHYKLHDTVVDGPFMHADVS